MFEAVLSFFDIIPLVHAQRGVINNSSVSAILAGDAADNFFMRRRNVKLEKLSCISRSFAENNSVQSANNMDCHLSIVRVTPKSSEVMLLNY